MMLRTLRTRQAVPFLLGLLLVAASPLAAEVDSVFRDFRPSGDFQLELDGSTISEAKFYFASRAGAYLVMAPPLSSPLLVSTRTGNVEKVSLLKVQKTDRGTLDLLADAAFDQVDRFTLESGQEIHFTYQGKKAVIKPTPPVLGRQSSETLRGYKPEYGLAADDYTPRPEVVKTLASQSKDVTVRVFLGTWCSVCSRLVPKVLKLDEELQESQNISFEYYGLSRQLDDDPLANQYEIRGVPTVVVLSNGKEVGRLGGRELNQPETALQGLLGS